MALQKTFIVSCSSHFLYPLSSLCKSSFSSFPFIPLKHYILFLLLIPCCATCTADDFSSIKNLCTLKDALGVHCGGSISCCMEAHIYMVSVCEVSWRYQGRGAW